MLKRVVVFVVLFAGCASGAMKDLYALHEPQVFEGLPVRVMRPINFDAGKKYNVKIKIFCKVFQMRCRCRLKRLPEYKQHKGIPIAKDGEVVGRIAGAFHL